MQDEEVGISFKDVLIYCFFHWRSALMVVLLGALLGGGYYAYKSQAKATTVEVQQAEETASVGQSVSHALNAQQENVIRLADYYENSILMQIDPTNEFVSSANLMIAVDSSVSEDQLDALVVAYAASITSSEKLDTLAAEWGTTSAYLRELISLDARGRDGVIATGIADVNNEPSIVTQDQDEFNDGQAAILTITAIGASAEQAASLCDALLEAANESQVVLSAQVVPHALEVVNEDSYTTTDYVLLQRQVERANAVSTANTALTTNTKNAPAAGSSSAVSGGGMSLKSLFKGAFIGGGAAFLLYGFILCLKYALDASPVMRGQLEAHYNLPEIGSYTYGSSTFYRGTTGFDRWLRKLSGLDDAPDGARVAEMVAANIRLYAGDAKTVLVSSSIASDKAQELTEALSAQLEDKSIILANDLANSAAARGKLKDADAVLFVEEYGKSTYENIDDEITLAVETEKSPLGLVMA